MIRYIAVVVVVIAVWSGMASAQEGPIPLSLQQAVKLAAEKNLDLQAELYNTALFEGDVRKFGGIYDLLLSALLNYEETRSVPTIGAATTKLTQNILQYNAGASQLLPTGGTLSAAFNNSWIRNDFSFPDNFYKSDITISMTQPLLQNFGREITELNISVARLNKEGAFEQFQTRLLNTVSQVMTQYFQLISLRHDLDSRKASLAVAQRVLDDTKARVKAGVLPAMEILNAEFGVATRQSELIDAERAVKDQSDALRLLLQLPAGGEIVPVDALATERRTFDEAAQVKQALRLRPDLRQLQTVLQTSELQSRVARTQTLPNLLFTASVAPIGFGETYGRDMERLGSLKYPTWGIGLQVTYPLGNHAAENEYVKTKLRVDQGKTQIQSLRETIANDIRSAIRAVDASYLQLDVTKRGRMYAEERLNAFIKKNQVGLATTKDVLDVENDLVNAKTSETRAVAAYNNALAQLWRVSGELLDRQGIKVSVKDADALYDRSR